MCLVAYHESGAQPDLQALRTGAAVNPHGSGYAVMLGPGNIIVQKSMDSEEMIRRFALLRADYPKGPAIFHSRAATSGTISLTNIQPFEVQFSDGTGVLAHNGTLQGTEPEYGWSDTRMFAESPFFGKERDADWRRTLHAYMCSQDSRLALLTPDGESHLFGDWDSRNVRNGVHYSNADWVAPPAPDGQKLMTDRLHLLYRRLAAEYRDGDAEAGQMMAALLAEAPRLRKKE